MVKKSAKFLALTLFFVMALILFMPKSSLYFFAEQNLQKFKVVVSNETLEDTFFTLKIHDLDITAQGIDTAIIKEADITLLLMYNALTLRDIQLSSIVDAYIPSHIEELHIRYTVFNPLVVNAEIRGEFGEADVCLHILDREVKARVKPSKTMRIKYKKTMKMLSKDENGEYVYAKTF